MINSILVPTDYSEASDTAIEHAAVMGNKTGAKIVLVNLCSSESEIVSAKEKLLLHSKKINYNIVVETTVRVGSYTDIPLIGKELSVDIMFLGSHGVHGVQKIFGSHSLEIVTDSEIPFIIVQKDSPIPSGYNKLLVTTRFHFENKQKIQVVGMIAKYFNSQVYILYNNVDPYMKAKSLNNVQFMQKHLDNIGVNYFVEKSTNENYNADTIALGVKINADLIAIMNMQKDDILGSGLLGNKYEEELIMNTAKIPILILNPNISNKFETTSAGFH
tara:strand:+ start:1341 stop:2162 length:822 start_codon:yes stop_codon:yes gene_type:complete